MLRSTYRKTIPSTSWMRTLSYTCHKCDMFPYRHNHSHRIYFCCGSFAANRSNQSSIGIIMKMASSSKLAFFSFLLHINLISMALHSTEPTKDNGRRELGSCKFVRLSYHFVNIKCTLLPAAHCTMRICQPAKRRRIKNNNNNSNVDYSNCGKWRKAQYSV